MRPLNLPAYPLRIAGVAEEARVFDPVRRRYVALTPEEWVRQHMLHYLMTVCGAPKGLIAVEKGFVYNGMARRADIVVHDRTGAAALVVECKAPETPVTQAVFDQAARYNTVLRARHLVVTNGLVHYCARIDWARGATAFLPDLPPFEAL